MFVRFWGTRGSIPSPGPRTVKYGGNTSCTELRADDGTLVILDCGTGARELGLSLITQHPVRAHILIGHSHWDHIQGFPFFVPAFLPNSEITVYAPDGFQQSLEQALTGQMHYSYFPIKLEDLRSHIRFVNIDEGAFQIGALQVQTQYLNHTAPTIGYRISSGNTTVVYATDHEPFLTTGGSHIHPGDQRHIEFLSQADLVIHDAQYTESEFLQKLGWGHSTVDYATQVAMEAGAKRLALFHHDPTHDDAQVQRMEASSQARASALRSELQVFSAAEGMELYLPEQPGSPHSLSAPSALEHRPVTGAKMLVVADDADQATLIESILVEDGIELTVVTNATAALREVSTIHPDMVILDGDLLGEGVFTLAQQIKANLRSVNMPLVVLATGLDEETLRRAQAAGVTDCLAKPFSPPMLYARIRAWLARSYTAVHPVDYAFSPPGMQPRTQPRPERIIVTPKRSGSEDLPGAAQPQITRRASRKAAILTSTPLFGILDKTNLNKLAAHSQLRDYAAGAPIVRHGEKENALFIIASGRVRVVGRASEERAAEILLGDLGPGQVFGEVSILDNTGHSATVLAVSRTRCLVVSRDDFLTCAESNPTIIFNLARMLAQRLRDADQILVRDGPDALTGLATRRTLEQVYRRDAAAARRRRYDIALLFLDVNGLKEINDTYGHLAGDDALQIVADALRSSTRESDIVARVGGDEFVALLSDTGNDGVRLVKARIQRTLEELCVQRGFPVPVTCSIGYSISGSPPEALEDMLHKADEAMYVEKRLTSAEIPDSQAAERPVGAKRRASR